MRAIPNSVFAFFRMYLVFIVSYYVQIVIVQKGIVAYAQLFNQLL